MTSKVTLNTLIHFVPQNENEHEIFNINKNVLTKYFKDTTESWSKGKFYLGGQIPMNPNEEITLLKIDNVKKINEQKMIHGGYCNSWEMASVSAAERQLNEIEIILKKYQEIYELRMKNVLDATILKHDLSNLIMKYLF